ncbi:MAG: DUF2269 family protein [Thermoanaerobaculia bacterium]
MNPTVATWMLFLHVLAAFWLAAGVFAGTVVWAQGRKASTLGERVLALRIAWRLANVYSLPGGIVVGLLGIGLLHPRGWTFGALWVQISMTLWLLMLLNGIFYLRPMLKKMLAAAEASAAAGVPSAELLRLAAAKAPRIAAEMNALGIVVITLLMIFKPV